MLHIHEAVALKPTLPQSSARNPRYYGRYREGTMRGVSAIVRRLCRQTIAGWAAPTYSYHCCCCVPVFYPKKADTMLMTRRASSTSRCLRRLILAERAARAEAARTGSNVVHLSPVAGVSTRPSSIYAFKCSSIHLRRSRFWRLRYGQSVRPVT